MGRLRVSASLLAVLLAVALGPLTMTREKGQRCYRKAGARSKGDNVGAHSPGTQQRRRRMARRRKGS